MNELFQNLAQINQGIKKFLILWNISEEYSMTYPKMSFYAKYFILQNFNQRSLIRNQECQRGIAHEETHPGDSRLPEKA